ncbi:MAG: FKBP-type peptidyl-prolyl cis-trans isomerase [Bacteroidota bacterium]
MKIKSLLLFATIVAFSAASCQQGISGKKVNLKSEHDSTSYALGILIGQQNKQGLENFPGGSDLDVTIMAQAFLQYLKGEETQMDPTEANEVVGKFFESANNREAQKNLEEGNAFLEKNKSRSGVVTTESGLQYEVITKGEGPLPTENDVVKVHYHGTLIDGKVFDSSVDRGEPVEFQLGQVIPGWVEALKLMPVGSKWKIFIPGNLGYGERGAGGDIGPNSVLIFDVELIDIVTE